MPVVYWYDSKEKGEQRGGTFVREEHGQFRFESYIGCVVDMYEQNGYHDSYFHAVIYLENEDRAFDHEYAATAYGGGGNAWIDASDELKAKYRDYLERKAQAARDAEIEELMTEGVPAYLCNRLYRRLKRSDIYRGCVKLLATKKFRSEFRKSLCNQLIAWLLENEPKYASPFSPKQSEYLLPFHRV